MNVQEINNTGKSIWTFIVTAIALTGAAVAALFLSNLARTIWHSRSNDGSSRKTRISQAIWLFMNPKAWKDMPRGTLLGVLSNGRFGHRSAIDDVTSAQNP